MPPRAIPRALLPHTVTAERYLGDSAHGATYGDPVDVRCWHRRKTGSATAADGSDVTTSGSITVRPEHATDVAPGARITDDRGGVTYVVAVTDNDSGGLTPLDHLKVDLA